MPRQSKKRTAAAENDAKGEAEIESILRSVHLCYTSAGGIEAIAADLGSKIFHPRKKATVMIVGNHSAGKSSFINWYCDRHVQSAGVAVESQGFTIVTSGKKDEPAPVKGRAMLQHPNYRHLADLEAKFSPTILRHIELRVSSSQAKKFPLVDLIDTPGLLDGNIEYPFDINAMCEYLAGHADLIFIFLDPIGQALCARTMDVVKMLTHNDAHAQKIRYYMTKSDTVPSEKDRNKLIVQITQQLVVHIKSTNALHLPTIFLPNQSEDDSARLNEISELCEGIEKTIQQKVQANLNRLEDDCHDLTAKLDVALETDAANRKSRSKKQRIGWGLLLFALALPLALLPCVLVIFREHLPAAMTDAAAVSELLAQVEASGIPARVSSMDAIGKILGLTFVLFMLARFFLWRAGKAAVCTKARLLRLGGHRDTLKKALRKQAALLEKWNTELGLSEGFD